MSAISQSLTQPMTPALLTSLISNLSADLHNSHWILQLLSLVSCLILAWLTVTLIKRIVRTNQTPTSSSSPTNNASFSHVLWPFVLTAYLVAAKLILQYWEHTYLLSLVLPIIASLAIIRFGFYIVRCTFGRDGHIGSVLTIFEKTFAILVWLAVVLYFTGAWQDLAKDLENTFLPIGHHKVSLLITLQALGSVALTLIIALWASAALEARLMLLPTMHTSLKVVFSRVGRAVLILMAILISLSIVGIDLTVLSVFGGALGVGLGLGLQKITSSYVSGFIILLERSMAIGDVIAVDKFGGKVTQINTRYTVLEGADGGESVIPNEMLISHPVQNYSLSNRSVLMQTDVVVAYDTDIEALLSAMIEVTLEVPRVLKEPIPLALVSKFSADGLELKLNFWIGDLENGRPNILSEVNRALLKLFRQLNIELAYPQRVVTLLNSSSKFPDVTVENA